MATENIRLPVEDYENQKFTDTALVKTTGFSGPIIELTYDSNDNPITISEYSAVREVTLIKNLTDDVSGSLNNKHLLLSAAGDTTLYYLWFNVNAAGIDPAVVGRTGIEVGVATNTTKEDLMLACVTEINTNFSADFVARSTGSHSFRVEALNYLTTTATTDVDTGFTIIRKRVGSPKILRVYTTIEYDANQNATNIQRNEYV